MPTNTNTGALHSNYLVTARQASVVAALHDVRAAAQLLPADEAAPCVRAIRRAWNTNNAAILRVVIDSVACLLEDVEGAWDARERCQRASSLVLGLEVFA